MGKASADAGAIAMWSITCNELKAEWLWQLPKASSAAGHMNVHRI